MRKHIESNGFAAPVERALVTERRSRVVAELFAIGGLVASTLVAATVISIGAARASVVDGVIDNEGSLFAVALVLGLVFIAIGGVSLLPRRQQRHRH